MLQKEKNDLVFILWGNKAQEYKKYFSLSSDKHNHFIIESSHPSPFSAHKGFIGSNCFNKANNYLLSIERKEIDWSIC